MNKGIIIGLILSTLILFCSYYLFKSIYKIKGMGGAILIAPIPILVGIWFSSFFLRNEVKIISYSAKTILVVTVLLLILAICLFFV